MRLALAEKGFHCEEYDVSLPLSEHNEPWFMHLNPTGEVPVLVHEDNIICDPIQIMDYLEQNFNDGEDQTTAQTSTKCSILTFIYSLFCVWFCCMFNYSFITLVKSFDFPLGYNDS